MHVNIHVGAGTPRNAESRDFGLLKNCLTMKISLQEKHTNINNLITWRG